MILENVKESNAKSKVQNEKRKMKEGERFLASTTGPQGSGIITSMMRAHGLAVLPEEREKINEGEEIVVELFRQNRTIE